MFHNSLLALRADITENKYGVFPCEEVPHRSFIHSLFILWQFTEELLHEGILLGAEVQCAQN